MLLEKEFLEFKPMKMETAKNTKMEIKPEEFRPEVAELIPDLLSTHTLQRSSAREKLEKMGQDVLPEVYKMIRSKNKQLQWEAAKTLENMARPESIDALIGLLEDEETDIRWIAAEGLINIGRASIIPLLEAIIEKGDSPHIQHGVHYALKKLLTREEKSRFSDLLHALRNTHNSAIIAPAKASRVIEFFNENNSYQ